MAWEIQEAVTDVIVEKTIKATKKYKVKSVLCGGGVMANMRLRRKLQAAINPKVFLPVKGLPASTCRHVNFGASKMQVRLFLPEKKFCTDNAFGIAIGGFLGKEAGWKNLRPKTGMEL